VLDEAEEPHQQATGEARTDPSKQDHDPHFDSHQGGIRRCRQHVRLRTIEKRFGHI